MLDSSVDNNIPDYLLSAIYKSNNKNGLNILLDEL